MGIPQKQANHQAQHNLLIVDDNDWNLDMMSAQLTQLGFGIHCASNGTQALDLINKHKFDLVLLDIMMPEINGLDLLAIIRKQHSILNLPIIMVTADDLQAHIIEALQRGANDYIIKPLNMSVASARINTQLTLKKLADLKDQFIKFASHDLKKPLIVSLDIIKTLEEECIPGQEFEQDSAQLLNMAHRSCETMQQVIDGFLDQDTAAANENLLDLNQLVKACIENNLDYANSKQISVLYEPCGQSIPLESNEFQIARVLENLIGNAIKFSLPGTTTTVRTALMRGKARTEICDEGPGLTQEDHNKLFSAHAELSNKPTGSESSSGIGLSLCKNLIENQNGRIGAFNNPDKGCTFWFEVPAKQQQ